MGLFGRMVCPASVRHRRKKLIEAVVGHIHGYGNSPPELYLAQCSHGWGVLPDPGGYLDQDYALISGMNTALNIYHVVTKVKSARGASIHNLSYSERKTLKVLVDKRLI